MLDKWEKVVLDKMKAATGDTGRYKEREEIKARGKVIP